MNKKIASAPHIDRDLSWMYFNRRILQEAMKPNVPLLERLSFLGIYSNNLDEFFRVRMATLSRIAECEDKSLRSESEHAKQLIKQINKLNNRYAKEYERTIHEVTDRLREENIFLLKENELDEEQQAFVSDFFRRQLSGFVSPVWLSAVKQLTEATDENIYLAVKMQVSEARKVSATRKLPSRTDYALIELPVSVCGRFIRLPDREERSYLMYLDDVIRFCLPMIFSGMEYDCFEAYAFKFTKDAEMEIDNDLRNGTLQKISKAIKSRKKGDALRVIYDAEMPKDLLKRVMNRLNLDKLDTVLGGGRYHNHKDLMAFPDCGRCDLKYPRWLPILKPELQENVSLLRLIQKQDRYIHVPFHSFDYYIRVLQEAALSKDVKSIKTTLYRLAKDSKVVKALICAARNGKKVTVVIELLARFDEASNIDWSKKMQDAGIHVIFGVEGLKVHSKITHIGMKTGSDIACISTGNFHEGNARMYTDYMLMTASRSVVNHITDSAIVKKLYEASAAGVPVDMLVRGNCSLVTGIPGISDTIHISGIIDRYLEHSRIFIFAAGGENKTFIGSADWMPRNLDNRIEVIAPVYDARIKEDLWKVIDFGLRDTCQGSVVDGTGENRPWMGEGESDAPFRSQEELYKYYLAVNEL